MVEFAVRGLPGAEHALLTRVTGKRPPRATAQSGELPYGWDQLRYEFGQGPGLEAIATTGVAPPQDLSREVRWPRLTGRSCPLHRRTSVVTWR